MPGSPHRVLVVDDEPYLADLVATVLQYEGYETEIAESAAKADALVRRFVPDLIVLDVMLPDVSGIDLCRQLRQRGCEAPVIFLTARDGVGDRVSGLTVGGDDYVTKPFSLDEIVARVRAVLRRTARPAVTASRLQFVDLSVDEDSREVRRGDTLIALTPTEYKLLRFLLVNARRVVSKGQILDHVWEYDFGGNDAVVQTYISYLRRKVDSRGPRLIHTVPRVGYVLRLADPDEPSAECDAP